MATTIPEGTPRVQCDTSGMLVIHHVLRRRFAVLPALVGQVGEGDRPRASVVADHVGEFVRLLRTHHETEDDHLWDVLESRSPACVLHVGLMRAQHAEVAALLTRLAPLLPKWKLAAERDVRERIAETLDAVNEALGVHLGEEETRILPVAAETMSQKEWDAFGDLGRKSVPKDRLLVQLGYVLDTIPPEQRTAWQKANLPAAIRVLYRAIGRGQFTRDYRRVYGTDPG